MKRICYLIMLLLVTVAWLSVSCNPEEEIIAVTGVTVNPTSRTLGVGESFSLSVSVMPANATDRSVVWTSSHPEVASVDANGQVSALKKGVSEIKVTTTDGGFSSTCAITVIERKTYKFRVSINGGEFAAAKSAYTYEMLPSGSITGVQRFQFYICEGDDVTPVQDPVESHYSVSIISQNPEGTVSTLLAGQQAYGGNPKYYTPWVYPEKAGSATVRVGYDDGEGNSISEDIKFTIVANAAKSISLGCSEFVLGAGNTRQLSATFDPVDATFQSLTWSSSNLSVAKVSTKGLVTAVAAGEAWIRATNEENIQGSAKIVVFAQPKAVDLGLSVLWSDTNLSGGATQSNGLPAYCFFAWGETVPEGVEGKKRTSYSDLTYWDQSLTGSKKYTKYCLQSSDGTVDRKYKLESMDDAASVILGNGWRMPTLKEVKELWNLNFSQSSSGNNKYNVTFSGNGRSITIPMWGARGTNTEFMGQLGFYWTSELYNVAGANVDDAMYLYFENQGTGPHDLYVYWRSKEQRYAGYCIRPVKNK